AKIMGILFDWGHDSVLNFKVRNCGLALLDTETSILEKPKTEWHDFCLYHSRFYARRDGKSFSKLCVADKYSICMMPAWLYLPMARATGEIEEYMALAKFRTENGEPKYASMKLSTNMEERWFYDVQEYLARWVEEHKNGGPDKWTPDLDKVKPRIAQSGSGVWQ
ncbi:MAG: hypothetical protein LLF89_04345, partial [Spirochaetaceae bacterium]|nr:hypothetical protein [Spirochaetaceae bacterium]